MVARRLLRSSVVAALTLTSLASDSMSPSLLMAVHAADAKKEKSKKSTTSKKKKKDEKKTKGRGDDKIKK